MDPRLLRPPQFDPRRLGDLEAWWDAGDESVMTLDSGRVAQWRDKSGRGRHAANSAAGSTQPDYITGGSNGRNVVRFAAASSQVLTVPDSTGLFNFLHDGTLSYVAAVVNVTGGANRRIIGNNTVSGNLIGFTLTYASSNSRLLILVGSIDAVVNTGVQPYDNTAIFDATTLHEIVLDAGNATPAARVATRTNGAAAIAANTANEAPVATSAAYDFQLGAAGEGASGLTGDICEVLLYSSQPTAAAQATLRRYLAAKWGVTLA